MKFISESSETRLAS
ncbi:hypothetical protein RDI58_028563 [Solanum bulbocastanum]|uniref:Uncharacterized protein n=1 Tax=Solanum bulbocastanum TaxID=147425 RepID=A0AAN8SS56_SOLBU